jgi:hypothetical protein
MIVQSDSMIGGLVFFFAIAVSALMLVAALLCLPGREFRFAGKILGCWSAFAAAYIALTMTVSVLMPQRVVNPGESYCADIWCISIQSVSKTPLGQDVAYKASVRIFSDASRVKTSAKGASVYLVDERGRHFPLVSDPSVAPFDTELNPGESVNTSLTFLAAADSQQLFIRGDEPNGPSRWFGKLAIGYDSAILHRPTLLRVQ